MKERTAQALAFFMDAGWSKEQAAGIVGNLIQESSLNTGARNGGDGADGSDSIGIGQWNQGRARALHAFAKEKGAAWDDYGTQLAFVDHELRGAEAGAGSKLRAAQTVDDATEAMISYERPSGWSAANPRGGHGWDNRLNNARSAIGMEPSEAPAPSPLSLAENNAYDDARYSRPYTHTELDALDRQAPQDYGLGDAAKDAFLSDSFTAWSYRRATEGAYDPAWKGPEATDWDDVSKTISPHYFGYVMGADSEEAYRNRIKFAQEDAERQQRLEDMGGEGTLVRLATGLFDPVTLPLNVVTGGIGASVARSAAGRSLAARMAAGGLTAGVSNAAIEAGFQAATDDPNADPLMAFGFGAVLGSVGGALARNPATRFEAEELRKMGNAALDRAETGEGVPYISGGQGSIGAAESGHTAANWILDDQHIPEGAYGKVRFDVVGQMTTSEVPQTRLLGFLLGEDVVGRKDRGVVGDPVTVVRKALEMRRWAPVEKVAEASRAKWMEETGVNRWNPLAVSRASDEFNGMVTDHIWATTKDPDTSPHVARAAAAYQQMFSTYQKDIVNPRWESGGYAEPLADVRENANYVPLYANHWKVAEVANTVPEKTMRKFLVQAINAHNPEIDPKLAKRMAKGYWNNLRRAGYGIEDRTDMALTMGDRDLFKEAYRAADNGLSDDTLDEMFDVLSGMADQVNSKDDPSPARLKRRSLLDYNFEAEVEGYGRLKVRDFFNKDVEFVSRRYNRTMSARVALAQTQVRNPATGELFMDGIRSQANFEKLKNWVREGHQERYSGDLEKDRKSLDNDLENLEFMWNGIHGRPMYGSEKDFGQWARRIKAFNFVRLMNNMGLNQVQETWKLISTVGAKAAFQQLPAVRRMVDEAGASRPAKDNLLDELEDVTGFGLEGLFGHHEFALMEDRIGSIEKGRATGMLDSVLDYGQKATSAISLMKAVHTYQSRWAIKAVTQRLYDMAKMTDAGEGRCDLSKLGGMEKERLAAAGIGEDEASLLFTQLLKNGETDGKRLTALGADKWDPQALVKFTHTMNRMTNRIVQTNDVGGLAKWMSKPMYSLFTQFRSFVFGAWGKSTLYNLHHFDARTLTLVLGELAFGAATYALRALPETATENGTDRFWEETMSAPNLIKNGFARTATASILPLIADTALFATPLGPQFGNARASGSPTDAFLGSPAVSAVKDAFAFSKGAMDSVVGDRELSQQEIRSGLRTLPFANWMPLLGLFSSLIEDRDIAPPRAE